MPDVSDAAILDAVRDFWRRYGYGPSVRDVARAVGLDVGPMHYRVERLLRAGRLDCSRTEAGRMVGRTLTVWDGLVDEEDDGA